MKSTLHRIRELIANGWTQNACSRNQYGTPVGPEDESATCFCLYGAGLRATLGKPDQFCKVMDLMERVTKQPPILFNDAPGRRHSEVLAYIDKVIAHVDA